MYVIVACTPSGGISDCRLEQVADFNLSESKVTHCTASAFKNSTPCLAELELREGQGQIMISVNNCLGAR